jgi:hypothetical protein
MIEEDRFAHDRDVAGRSRFPAIIYLRERRFAKPP